MRFSPALALASCVTENGHDFLSPTFEPLLQCSEQGGKSSLLSPQHTVTFCLYTRLLWAWSIQHPVVPGRKVEPRPSPGAAIYRTPRLPFAPSSHLVGGPAGAQCPLSFLTAFWRQLSHLPTSPAPDPASPLLPQSCVFYRPSFQGEQPRFLTQECSA